MSIREIRSNDGSHVIWDGREGILLIPGDRGGVIIATGRFGQHPFDTAPRAFDAGAVDLIITSLQQIVGDRGT